MTRVQNREDGLRVAIIEPEPDGVCDLCGKNDELRPYGPNGENICFDCGMKNEEMTKKRFSQVVFGEGFDS
jgi:hypothetical protein